MNPLRRTIHPEIKVLDAKTGIVEYIASDETLDSYREILRADGWRFTNFAKNSPFVDSHDYQSIDRLLGKVVDFHVTGRQLVETVQWAKDVPENTLARLGWKMTEAGFLKAVSVGFWPTKTIRATDPEWPAQLADLQLPVNADVRAIFTEQEQVELSAVILGANPNALAKAYKAGAINDADLDTISRAHAARETASSTTVPEHVDLARARARTAFLVKLHTIINRL